MEKKIETEKLTPGELAISKLAFEAGRQEGRKEVVEWIENTTDEITTWEEKKKEWNLDES